MTDNPQQTIHAFQETVNMTPKQLASWLETADSKSVGQKKDRAESVGHQSGRQIVEILQKPKSEYTDSDLSHMKKVVAYVKRHLAQRPDRDIEHTAWRYSLMNWGHDPLKK